jgi:mono/diheme cytochrome c family protein
MRFSKQAMLLCAALGVASCGDDGDSKVTSVPASPQPSRTAQVAAVPVASSNAKNVSSGGKAVYVHYCAGCHDPGPGHPGTMRLDVRLGADSAVLRERKDLAPEYVKIVVRNGFQMMPAFRPTEIADAELEDLAAYVTAKHESKAANAH